MNYKKIIALFLISLTCATNAAADNNERPSFLDGKTFLHVAAAEGNLGCIKKMIRFLADANIQSRWDSHTRLHFAAENGHLECIKELLAHGADVNLRDKDSWTALHYAASHNHVASINALLASKTIKRDARDHHG